MSGPKKRRIGGNGYHTVEDEVKSLREAAKEIESRLGALGAQPNSFTPQEQRDIQDLKKKLESLLSQLLLLPDEVEKQREDIESLKQQIKKLRKENQELKSHVERLESQMRTLELGQMMTVFERNLSKFILSPEKKVGDRGGLIFMLDYFDLEKKGGKNLQKHRDRWEKFLTACNNMEWTKLHLRVFKNVKKARNLGAHDFKIDYNHVEQQIEKLYVHWEEQCWDFVNMHKKLNCILALSHIAFEFEDVIVPFILPRKRRRMSVAEMIKWLKDNNSSEEGKAANTRWSNLVQGKKWTSKHEEALSELKRLKCEGTILQDIDFEEAKTHVADYMRRMYKQQSSDIIDMMKTFPKLSGLPWKLPKYKP